jgi:hypothetical protein
MEKELELDPRFATDEFAAEFARFKRENEEFQRQSRRHGVRARDVRRLKEAIHRILLRVEPGAAADFDSTFESTSGGERPAPPPAARPAPAPAPPWQAEADPLTEAVAAKILHAVDLSGDGVGPGRASTSGAVANLGLEPWEFLAALDIVRRGRTPGQDTDPVGRLLFNAAALRARMDEQARELRGHVEGTPASVPPGVLDAMAACLDRSQEIDREFRAALLAAEDEEGDERHRQLTRSRFRHLRAFTGLWLLQNAFGG